MANGITLLGLGPGDPAFLTQEALNLLNGLTEIWLRTEKHPAVVAIPESVKIQSFDHLYDTIPSFEELYKEIVDRVVELGKRSDGVVYAVPGHPNIAEMTCEQIIINAKNLDIPLTIIAGMSFLEPLFSAIEIDPLPNASLVDALELAVRHVPSFPPDAHAIITQIYDQQIASEVKLTLASLYPDEHPVKFVHAAGTVDQLVEDLPLYQIDRSKKIDLLSTLYVPPLGEGTSFEAFHEVIAHLRAPDGCPWDREQTHQSLRPHLIEESYELLDALDDDDPAAIEEELGDLLLQIVLHAQIATEDGSFNMAHVIRKIHDKLIRRHPHVFADVEINEVNDVLHNWEMLKSQEKRTNGELESSILDGTARTLPALTKAEIYQKRAARVGFDWPDIDGVRNKVEEEWREVLGAENDDEWQIEIGDFLFAIVNLARWLNVDAESALRAANNRFRERFEYIEEQARSQGREVTEMTLEEMDALWDEAKGK